MLLVLCCGLVQAIITCNLQGYTNSKEKSHNWNNSAEVTLELIDE